MYLNNMLLVTMIGCPNRVKLTIKRRGYCQDNTVVEPNDH